MKVRLTKVDGGELARRYNRVSEVDHPGSHLPRRPAGLLVEAVSLPPGHHAAVQDRDYRPWTGRNNDPDCVPSLVTIVSDGERRRSLCASCPRSLRGRALSYPLAE